MTAFKIESGIRVPTAHGKRMPDYPWADMEPGDCLFIPCDNGERQRVRVNAYQSANAFVRKNRLALMAVSRSVEGGVRIWIVPRED